MSTCMRTVQKVMDLNFPHEKKIKHMRYLLEGRCMAPSSGMCKFSPTCKKHQSLVVSLHCQRAVESYQIFICHKITQLLEQQYCIRFYLKLCDAQSETIWQIQQTSVGNVISIMWLGSATITWKMTKHRWRVDHVAMSPIQAKRIRSCKTHARDLADELEIGIGSAQVHFEWEFGHANCVWETPAEAANDEAKATVSGSLAGHAEGDPDFLITDHYEYG